MKKRIIVIPAVILIISILSGYLAVANGLLRSEQQPLKNWEKECASADGGSLSEVKEGTVTLENDGYLLSMNAGTTDFTVFDKKSGNEYRAVCNEEDATARMRSVLTVLYYDNQSVSKTMNTYENSVQYNAFSVATDGKTIRVIYTFRNTAVRVFAPEILSEDVMKKIMSALDSGSSRRFKLKYTRYTYATAQSEIKKKYPALENGDLYLLNSDYLQEKDYTEITGYMEAAGFSRSDYTTLLKKLEIEESADEDILEFTVPIEFRLTDSGFSYEVLTDGIVSASDSYTLTDVYPLEYFSAVRAGNTGYMLIPDGSGALVSMTASSNQRLECDIYGSDPAIQTGQSDSVIQGTMLPVYGQSCASNGYFAIIDGADAVATVNVMTAADNTSRNAVGASFRVRGTDMTDIGESAGTPVLNLYDNHYVYEHPSVSYYLTDDLSNSYCDMAKIYRAYLKKTGVLTEKLPSGTLPLLLDFTGYTTVDDSVVGISVKKKLLLSSLSEITKAVKGLNSSGVKGLSVRLKAVGNGGWRNNVYDSFKIDRSVGTQKQMNELAAFLTDNGGRLYADADFSLVAIKNFAFAERLDQARNLEKGFLKIGNYNIVTRTFEKSLFSRYVVSPGTYARISDLWYKDFKKSTEAALPSWSTGGKFLTSDFNRKFSYDRAMSRDAVCAAFGSIGESGKVMTDGGNAYVLPYTDTVVNIPLCSSDYKIESCSVPFYAIAVHGYMRFSGLPLNLAADPEKALLNTIESGAAVYYSCFTADDDSLTGTDYRSVTFPDSISGRADDISALWKKLQSQLGDLQSKEITGHSRITDNVTVTVYEDETEVYVNYGDKDYSESGITVGAQDFAVIRKSGVTGG